MKSDRDELLAHLPPLLYLIQLQFQLDPSIQPFVFIITSASIKIELLVFNSLHCLVPRVSNIFFVSLGGEFNLGRKKGLNRQLRKAANRLLMVTLLT